VKRNSEAMTRRHIWIDDETWDKLIEHYEDTLGPSAAIRKILKAFFVSLEAKAQRKGTAQPPLDPETL